MSEVRPKSRLRLIDTLLESWAEVTSRPARTAMTALGVALGTGAIVATLTLVSTMRFQISDEFDALRATQVELRVDHAVGGSRRFPPSVDRLAQLVSLSGVRGVAVVREVMEEMPVSVNQLMDPTGVPDRFPIFGAAAGSMDGLGAEVVGGVDFSDGETEREVVASETAARELGITIGDRIFVGGLGFTVAGLLSDSPRLPALTSGLIMPLSSADRFGFNPDRDRVIVTTTPGAALAVAKAAPLALEPAEPSVWIAYAPQDDRSLRLTVDEQLRTLLLVLGTVVALVGAVAIGNSTLSSVLQRIHEIGLRRALGARPSHIVRHVIFDTAMIGLVGGLAGSVTGLVVVLSITAWQGWVPVIDPTVPLIASIGGLLVGVVAGIYPALLGSRLQPTAALRRE